MERDIPIKSGNEVIDGLFRLCVDFLLWLGELLGMSYYEVNIWIFCVVWPLFTLFLMYKVTRQWFVIRNLNSQLKNVKSSPAPGLCN